MGNEEGHFANVADLPKSEAVPDTPDLSGETAAAVGANRVEETPKIVPWPTFIQAANPSQIKERFVGEVSAILKFNGMEDACVLGLLEPNSNIDSTDLDQIFTGLTQLNRDRSKDVVLLLLTRGGAIEPAYLISKLCKSFAAKRFIAVVPRFAKSAATLIALGADEIHMGPLGELGPIDPQLSGGLPALAVSQALKTMASLAQEFPGSADMFARYLRMALKVEQIGYCDRISESAVQYAVRLLSTKHGLPKKPELVAKELVHEYKDHGFVIEIEEARMHLGGEWIKSESPELTAAEAIYTLFDMVNFFLGFGKSRYLIVVGGVTLTDSIHILKRPTE